MSDQFEKIVETMERQWGGVTLADFYAESLLEDKGVVYQSLKNEYRRLFIIVCVTEPDAISTIERNIELTQDKPPCDWSKTTIVQLLFHTLADGWTYEDLRNESGLRIALIFCAVAPDKIELVEKIFDLPRA